MPAASSINAIPSTTTRSRMASAISDRIMPI
jgi:hypothetical protein